MEKKERIADLLRAEAQSEAAEKFLGVGGLGRVHFNDGSVGVYICDDQHPPRLSVSISWSALGTVGVGTTLRMARGLQSAAVLAGRIQAIIDDTQPPEQAIEIPRVLLEAATDELGSYLEEDGGCDHDVGICSCEVSGIISHLEHLLGRHEEKPDPYNCGHCAPDEGELGEENLLVGSEDDGMDRAGHGL